MVPRFPAAHFAPLSPGVRSACRSLLTIPQKQATARSELTSSRLTHGSAPIRNCNARGSSPCETSKAARPVELAQGTVTRPFSPFARASVFGGHPRALARPRFPRPPSTFPSRPWRVSDRHRPNTRAEAGLTREEASEVAPSWCVSAWTAPRLRAPSRASALAREAGEAPHLHVLPGTGRPARRRRAVGEITELCGCPGIAQDADVHTGQPRARRRRSPCPSVAADGAAAYADTAGAFTAERAAAHRRARRARAHGRHLAREPRGPAHGGRHGRSRASACWIAYTDFRAPRGHGAAGGAGDHARLLRARRAGACVADSVAFALPEATSGHGAAYRHPGEDDQPADGARHAIKRARWSR